MHVSVVGSGRLGTTTAACLVDIGHDATIVGADPDTAAAIEAGESPVEEPGLAPLVSLYGGDRLRATTDYDAVPDGDLTVLAVPAAADAGHADTDTLAAAADAVGNELAGSEAYHLVAVRSPVLPGTTAETVIPALEAASDRTDGTDLGVAVTPTFQRPGAAVDDFMDPERLVVGSDGDERVLDLLAELYEPLVAGWDVPVVELGRREAELLPFADSVASTAQDALVADIATVCDELDVDARAVVDALRSAGHVGDAAGRGPREAHLPTAAADLAAQVREAGADPAMLDALAGDEER
jgi:UDPglucose 6-dehydrogenase